MTEASNYSATTLRHGFPYIIPGQAQKHVTHNTALEHIDAVTHLCLDGLNVDVPPQDPIIGTCYDISASPKGVFANNANHVAAYQDTGWHFFPKIKGMLALHTEDNILMFYDGNRWEPILKPTQPNELPMLGVNTLADSTNKLSVKSESILFAADDLSTNTSGDLRVSLSKINTSDTASILYQSDFSPRVETGLMGSDNYQIKVSPDGSNLKTALEVDATNGNVGLGKSPAQALDILKTAPGITRIAVTNNSKTANLDSSIDIKAGNNKYLSFLQYNAATAYMVSNSSVMYYQLTGSNPVHRFYLGGFEVIQMAKEKISMNAPARLPNISVSALPSPATSGSGALIYIPDENTGGSVAYSDGTNWRRCSDKSIVP